MSWFMVVSGKAPTITENLGVKLVSLAEAQEHARDVAVSHGLSSDAAWLVDDSTHTTDDLRTETRDAIFEGTPFPETKLGLLLDSCSHADCSVLVWDASPGSPKELRTHDSWSSFRDALADELGASEWRAEAHAYFNPAQGRTR